MRVLILGGTRRIGPYFVRAALDRGHEVTVFNRGVTPDSLPDQIERLVGDRTHDLGAIRGRQWDAAFDLAAYTPDWVRSFGVAVGGHVDHYTFVSTVLVYKPSPGQVFDESSAVVEYEGEEDPYLSSTPPSAALYGPLKVLCEHEAESQFPGRTLVLRPGHIVGPGDSEMSFAYWSERFARPGPVLVAGEPTTPMQVIDVRDFAVWAVRMAEQRATGIYNVTGPAAGGSLADLLEASQIEGSEPQRIVWVPAHWLSHQETHPLFARVMFWTEEANGAAKVMRMGIKRALDRGLRTRPLRETATDTFNWHRTLSTSRQAELLAEIDDRATPHDLDALWTSYLSSEAKTIEAWQATH